MNVLLIISNNSGMMFMFNVIGFQDKPNPNGGMVCQIIVPNLKNSPWFWDFGPIFTYKYS